MTEVTEAMIEAGRDTGFAWLLTEGQQSAIYLAMEAARIPAPAPDAVGRDEAIATSEVARMEAGNKRKFSDTAHAYIWQGARAGAKAALSAIPIPASTGEVERLLGIVAPMFPITTGQSCPDYADVHFGAGHSSQVMTTNPDHWDALNDLFAALTDHTTKGAE